MAKSSRSHDGVSVDDPIYAKRHSAAHLLAEVVLEEFPDAKIAIGPPVEHGFYYDFDLPRSLNEDDLVRLEDKVKTKMKQGGEFEYSVVDEAQARKIFADQPYKLELIDKMVAAGTDEYGEASEETVISTYKHGDFEDLCRGPHVDNIKKLDSRGFKLSRVAGAYWRGDESRPMLQRVYGLMFNTKEELAHHLWQIEEAKRRDHRRLGEDLDLFSFPTELGGGLAVWHPKGARIRKVIEDYSRLKHERGGYEFVYSPHIAKSTLFETSGHLDFYSESMYPSMQMSEKDEKEIGAYYPKPMNCPMHCLIYRSRPRSYRELPLRLFELGTVYRYERSGALHGMLRIRGFTQDDAHIFCTREDMQSEVASLLEFVLEVVRAFGFEDFTAYLATRPAEKSIGDDEVWDLATEGLRLAIEKAGIPYEIDEGGGAFYGPKIDMKLRDAVGREWQLSTIQADFQLPERFNLEYQGSDGQAHQPIMLHRALFGSVERFFATLLEHYAGAFPAWLSPEQVRLVPITTDQEEYCNEVAAKLRALDVRVTVDGSDDRMQAKIRKATVEKVPYILVVGRKEAEANQVALRLRSGEDEGPQDVDAVIARITENIATRNLSLAVT